MSKKIFKFQDVDGRRRLQEREFSMEEWKTWTITESKSDCWWEKKLKYNRLLCEYEIKFMSARCCTKINPKFRSRWDAHRRLHLPSMTCPCGSQKSCANLEKNFFGRIKIILNDFTRKVFSLSKASLSELSRKLQQKLISFQTFV